MIGKRLLRKLIPLKSEGRLSSRQNRPIVPGLPEGISFERLDQLCRERLGAQPLKSASHMHLSGWKYSGAYRLMLTTTGGQVRNVIYKNAIYGPNHIPAVIGLPVLPGPPEYAIYSRGGDRLAPMLPEVYDAVEVMPNRQYHYLLEDLADTHRPLSYKAPEIVEIAAMLPALHETLLNWMEAAGAAGLLHYGQRFSVDLADYTETHLKRYQPIAKSDIVTRFMENWPDIKAVYLRPEFFALHNSLPLHGDFSPANIYLANNDPKQVKLLDWEWAGIGTGLLDLAALLKRSAPELEARAVAVYHAEYPRLSEADHQRLYEWCQLERGISDVGYLAKQEMDSERRAQTVPRYIERSIERATQAYKRLQ